jgi:hypothetical protein
MKGVKEKSGNAAIVFDKFPVVRPVVVIALRRADYGE